MRALRFAPFVTAAVLALAGCQDPDVGQPCDVGVNTSTLAGVLLETGKTECDGLVCMAVPDSQRGTQLKSSQFCSKTCVATNECSQDETGLVCRNVVLDDAFINKLDPAVRNRYLPGNTAITSYCAPPLR
jgi:hypothetical protein